jgi:hypothetical protein
MIKPLYTRTKQQQANYLREVVRRAIEFDQPVFTCVPWWPDVSGLLVDWKPNDVWFNFDLTNEELGMFFLFIAEALESEA